MQDKIHQILDDADTNKHPEKKPLAVDLMVLLFSGVASFFLLFDADLMGDPMPFLGFALLGFGLGWALKIAQVVQKKG